MKNFFSLNIISNISMKRNKRLGKKENKFNINKFIVPFINLIILFSCFIE